MSYKRRTDRTRVHWVNQFAVAPYRPGGTRHHEMSKALRSQGYDARVIASDLNLASRTYTRRRRADDGRGAIHENVAGVPFVWLYAGNYERNDWRRALSMLIFARHVLVYLLRTVNRGDVVVGSTPQLLSALAARIAAFLRRAPFILEVRDLWPESLAGVTGKRSLMTWGLRIVADLLYRTSSAIIILAEGSRDQIIRHGGRPKRIVYIPNGVDVAEFTAPMQELPESLRWVEHHPTFVYAGAHGPANGLDMVMDAAEVLNNGGSGRDIRILLIGDGASKTELQADAQARGLTNVAFHDPIAKDVIPSLLRRCTGGLMVLKDVELFGYAVSPNKLFDYLAGELPVVTNVPGDVADIVRGASAGVVVPPGDATALAGAMQAVARGEYQCGSGLDHIREHHDREHLATKMARVIDAVQPRRKTA